MIYGAMPTGMESTIKLRIGDFLLTGVVFGNTAYKIGQEVKFEIGGEDILLFDRKSGKRDRMSHYRYVFVVIEQRFVYNEYVCKTRTSKMQFCE